MQPLVSVVIPSYKGYLKLDRAINSILKQTYRNIEIIVVDDNEPDTMERTATEKVIEKFQNECLKYIQHSHNMNGAAARNTGISAASGKYICFLDDDDIYLPCRIEKSVNILEENKSLGAVFCNVLQLFSDDYCTVHIMKKENLTVKGTLLYEAAIGTGSNLFLRADVVRRIQGFDTAFLRHQDLEFSLRVFEACSVGIINEVLVIKAFNGNSNVPTYHRMKMVKEQYNRKFQNQINALEDASKKEYYFNCYKSLYISALYAEDYSEAMSNLKQMKKYGFIPGMKQLIQMVLAMLHMYHRVKALIEHENGPQKSQEAVVKISDLDLVLQKQLRKYDLD